MGHRITKPLNVRQDKEKERQGNVRTKNKKQLKPKSKQNVIQDTVRKSSGNRRPPPTPGAPPPKGKREQPFRATPSLVL